MFQKNGYYKKKFDVKLKKILKLTDKMNVAC